MRELQRRLKSFIDQGAQEVSQAPLPDHAYRKFMLRLEDYLFRLLYKKEMLLERAASDPSAKKLADDIGKTFSEVLDYKRLFFERVSSLKPKYRTNWSRIAASWVKPQRLVVLITRRCQLRCAYCVIPDYSQDMSSENLSMAVDFMLTTSSSAIQLQFLGGEPMLRFDLIQQGVALAERRKASSGKTVSYLVTTNGLLLSESHIQFFKQHNFTLELSCDGDMETQLRQRSAGESNYFPKLLSNMELLRGSGVDYFIIMTVTPDLAPRLFENFLYLVQRGHRRIQVNYAIGQFWRQEAIDEFVQQMHSILAYVGSHPETTLINATQTRREPVTLNGELTVDRDGKLFLETGICLSLLRDEMGRGRMDDGQTMDEKGATAFQTFLSLSRCLAKHRPDYRSTLLNNIQMGWLIQRRLGSAGAQRTHVQA